MSRQWMRYATPLALMMALLMGWGTMSLLGPSGEAFGQRQAEQAGQPGMMMQMSPRMMQMMHRMHAGDDSAWDATSDRIVILRGNQLLHYDPETLELTAETQLPEEVSPVFAIEAEEAEEQGNPQRRGQREQQMQRRLQRLMMRAQASLPTDVRIVEDSIYITRGDHLLHYNGDLELQESVQLPALPEMVEEASDEPEEP